MTIIICTQNTQIVVFCFIAKFVHIADDAPRHRRK